MVLLALAGCDSGVHGGGAQRPTTTRHPSASATPTAVAGPARPTEAAAKIGPRDSALADWLSTRTAADDCAPPSLDAVVVVRRGSRGVRDFGWISGGHFCLGHWYRKDDDKFAYGTYDAGTATATPGVDGSVLRTDYRLDGIFDRSQVAVNVPGQLYYTLAIIPDDPGPFRITGDNHQGILYQTRAVMGRDHTATFLEWTYRDLEELPLLDSKICSASSGRCVQQYW
ncbi:MULTISPECIES: hypothetical protein [Streptomyces]|uniref:hypothetical protein n=1 Tax=Streptomyces TaxID=1883 RepID=UPI0037A10D37